MEHFTNFLDAMTKMGDAFQRLGEALQELDLPDYTVQENLASEQIIDSCFTN